MRGNLTEKMSRLIDVYLTTWNFNESYVKAGYKDNPIAAAKMWGSERFRSALLDVAVSRSGVAWCKAAKTGNNSDVAKARAADKLIARIYDIFPELTRDYTGPSNASNLGNIPEMQEDTW